MILVALLAALPLDRFSIRVGQGHIINSSIISKGMDTANLNLMQLVPYAVLWIRIRMDPAKSKRAYK